ncbi:hypothetical protein K466DRAFT_602883 [Polyporus arcularius HHB13444]|uniref:MYND-type domain-containing protein n=1 Tax=Polyporus arcularius HHB13444 TaxID=1314778 RepID=A0A5C3P179_9APHY|nr:hypothetical protein K466DRAFT_602883 [Polyporus arcularius HHB13444]
MADGAYEHRDWCMVEAVVRVWVALCADAALGRELLQQGILGRTLRLVNTDVCSSQLTSLFTLLAHHGDETVKVGILRYISDMFVGVHQRWHLDSHRTSTFIIMALYHCLDAVTFPSAPSTSHALFNTDLPAILLAKHILEHFPKPHVPHAAMVHAFPLLITCAMSCSTIGIAPLVPVLEFLTLLIKSRNIGLRCVAIWTFGRLCPGASNSDSTALPYVLLDDIRDERVPPGGEIAESKRCRQELLTLVQNLADDGDLWQFGVKLAEIIMQGRLQYQTADLARLEGTALANFATWGSLLPEVTMVVMKKDCRYRDKAHVISLEHGVYFAHPGALAPYAHQILHWDPKHAYAHVIFCEYAPELETALQTAIDGLELPDLTPYLRRRLLLRALELSYTKACAFLLRADATELQRLREGKGWLRRSLDYAHRFIKDAPKDSQDLPHVADLCMNITLMLRGPSLDKDLAPIQPILRVIDRSLTTLKDLGIDIGDNPIRSGNRLFVQHYPQGLAKWGVFLTGFHEQDHAIRASIAYPRKSTRSSQIAQRREPEEGNVAEPGERDATVWWESAAAMTIHSLLRGPLRCCCRASELNGCVQLGPGLVTLLQCTWCGDTTALIKQCGGCKHAWYCDPECQRAHWPEHRNECKVYI